MLRSGPARLRSATRADDVQLDYGRAPDREPPKLQTSSTPTAGTKVKPGRQIKVTLVARDDANAWQTGIRSIQVIAQAPGGDERVGEQGYPPVIRPECAGRPEPRTLEVTYTVPSNPPPIRREWNAASSGIGRLHMSLTLRRAQR